jgi:hypothetical protein
MKFHSEFFIRITSNVVVRISNVVMVIFLFQLLRPVFFMIDLLNIADQLRLMQIA